MVGGRKRQKRSNDPEWGNGTLTETSEAGMVGSYILNPAPGGRPHSGQSLVI